MSMNVSIDLPSKFFIPPTAVTFDGAGATLTTGHKVWSTMPHSRTISGWVLLGDTTGSVVISISKCTYAAFDTVSDITASNPPSITSANKNQDTILTGWTLAVNAGDILEFQITSVTSFTKVQLFLDFGAS